MAHGALLATVAAVVTVIGFSASSGAAVESTVTIPGATPPTPQVERLSDEQVRAEVRRLSSMKMECSTQARQAFAAQQGASAAGRASPAPGHGQGLRAEQETVGEAEPGVLPPRN